MLRAASRASLAALRERQQQVMDEVSSSALPALSEELFQIGQLLTAQSSLRRTLGDHSTDDSRRAELFGRLLHGKASDAAVEIAKTAAALRWSTPWDFSDALELASDDALLASAEREGNLGEVEDELFRFERILDDQSALTVLLDEVGEPAERRVELLHRVVGGKVSATTEALLAHAVASARKPTLSFAIDDLLEEAARRKARSVAKVTSAIELSAQQQERLTAALSELYGRAIDVRIAVDPAVRGGLVVRVGDELIDGSVASRLADAKSALAG